MNIYGVNDIDKLIEGNPYVGRGIVIGKSEDGTKAVFAYFIMGRSENSRNRVFVEEGDQVVIHPFDPSKVEDPSLIIYWPIRACGYSLVVTNGDQTDTIVEFLEAGKTFEQALETRKFEPDAPNFTPRISGILNFEEGNFKYKLSILKSGDENGSVCNRQTFDYEPISGLGHFIHTYVGDGNPLPTFVGEPKRVKIPNCIDEFANKIWNNLNEANKISMYVRYIDLKTGKEENRMVNKNS